MQKMCVLIKLGRTNLKKSSYFYNSYASANMKVYLLTCYNWAQIQYDQKSYKDLQKNLFH